MKAAITLILLLCLCTVVKAQDSVYTFVDEPPRFPGGEEALSKFIFKNLHPNEADTLDGSFPPPTRCARFIVEKDGTITHKTIDGRSPANYLRYDKEIIAMLDKMPKWKPGRHRHKTVPVSFFIPLRVCVLE